jgi:hypothetical protein
VRRQRASHILIAVLLAGGLAALVGPAAGQQRLVISGFVQWVSGASMQVVADNGFSIRVDLQLVDLSEYNALRGGDRVRVFGYISPDRSRLIGERIDRVDAPNVYDSYTPYPQAP